MRLGALGLPSGDGGRVEAIANTGDDSTDNEAGKFRGACHQSSADNHDGRAQEDRPPPTQDVTDPDTDDSAAETAGVVRGHRNAYARSC